MSRLYPIDLNHPHNFVLQYVYDWGLIGGAAATSLLALLGVAILRARAQSLMVRFTAIAAYVSTCTAALIDSPLFHPLPMIGAIALIAPVFNRQSTV
jgi:O-antigen ligase